jgi:aminoglycoside 3-N-acetyltransferase
MPHTTASLLADLTAAEIRNGDALVVHASMKSLGPITGGADAVIEALVACVGPTGTLLMPTFSSPASDGIYDVRTTPSRVGALTERFRLRAKRSLHPTHSVCALGQHVDWLDGHETRSGLGVDTPLHRAARAGSKVLMIGCGLTSCSTVHIAEAMLRMPYLGRVWFPGYDKSLQVIREDGSSFDWTPIDPPTCSNAFDVVESELSRLGLISRVRIGGATSLLMRSSNILDIASALLRRDPTSLLCDQPDCPVCPEAKHLVSITR